MINWISARLREPSTYAGLGLLLAAYHFPHADAWTTVLTDTGVWVGAHLAIVLSEKKK